MTSEERKFSLVVRGIMSDYADAYVDWRGVSSLPKDDQDWAYKDSIIRMGKSVDAMLRLFDEATGEAITRVTGALEGGRRTGRTQLMLEQVRDSKALNIQVVAHNHPFAQELAKRFCDMAQPAVRPQKHTVRRPMWNAEVQEVRFVTPETAPWEMAAPPVVTYVDHYVREIQGCANGDDR